MGGLMYVGQEQVEGDVLTILYSAEESGWSVFDVKDTHSGKSVRVTGVAPGVAQGEHIRAFGQWTQNTTYGPQFKSKEIHVFPPSSEKGLEAFLAPAPLMGSVRPTRKSWCRSTARH